MKRQEINNLSMNIVLEFNREVHLTFYKLLCEIHYDNDELIEILKRINEHISLEKHISTEEFFRIVLLLYNREIKLRIYFKENLILI